MRQTLLHIRNYAEVLHPAQFKDGTVLGWKIRLLNYIRYRLEVWVQELVLVAQCREAKLSLGERIGTFRRFKEENQAEVDWMYRDESRTPTPALMDEAPSPDADSQPRLVLDTTPRSTKRPMSLDNLIQTYGGGAKPPRYKKSGHSNVTDFEPVGGSSNDGEFVS